MKYLKGAVIFIILAGVVSIIWYGSYENDMKKLEDGLRTYLTVEKGLNENDIISITARRSKMPKYPVVVKLKDDPQEYVYTYRGEQWVQLTPDPHS
ncbi:DUF3139 domain-containing protein [Paenibacillus polysaccharolyticus]|uniref:DUF3139 domain-containing protein n=1 Tax=Paenibacillus TaxID=44249 RepID=UPI0020A050DD|nr:DUF3139 domain-containing protein [Paenibacillus polysaccharolyticus]MCP1132896.1 DUF3139 domain-containing protein [Paenibacillus polysaccharolyticus]